jgi:ABC-type transport system involved in cytochrome bd biosynthesis fused ATPase/permease subunit
LHDVIEIAEGKSLLYVTHRLDELTSFDEVVVIDNGRATGRGARA